MKRERFLAKVAETPGGCWEWTGWKQSGYGRCVVGQHPNTFKAYAHRVGWEILTGEEIPADREIHHLCRNRSCVNPEHLVLVGHAEHPRLHPELGELRGRSNRLKTHCPYGHPYSGENLYVHEGRRHCVACSRERTRRWRVSTQS